MADKLTQELIEIMRFTEEMSAKLHNLDNEKSIFKAIENEFRKSGKYTSSIMLLHENGKELKIPMFSKVVPALIGQLEKVTGLKLAQFKIKLKRQSCFLG